MIQANSIVLHDNAYRQWLYFTKPVRIYEVHDKSLLIEILNEIEQAVDTGNLFAAGFLSYEAASGINPELETQPQSHFPLCWFGLYHAPEVVKLPDTGNIAGGLYNHMAWQASVSDEQYAAAFRQIHNQIREGSTYQVNYSYRLHATLADDPWQIFTGMVAGQGPGYSACVALPDWTICSASPELFFNLENKELSCRPMKGTVSRGLTLSSDSDACDRLHDSEKERAENLMIVDMVRNDLGRIARTGTVKTGSLFNIEKYPTVWQMTSNVSCQTDSGLSAILQALYPAASITGAPKRYTMDIIRDLECSPRNIYTGTIGYYAPGRRAQFNVAIRTVLINNLDQLAEYGVGGGIVWDSNAESELQETHCKASVLSHREPEFSLLESILWESCCGFWLLPEHLQRLRQSATYFSRQYDENLLVQQLDMFVEGLKPVPHKIRVLISMDGEIILSGEPVPENNHPVRVGLAKQCIDANNVFLYHKTTHRLVYEQAIADVPDVEDVLLWNSKGEVTESCTSNIVVEMDDKYYTPPIDCGLLPGTYRSSLLLEGKLTERSILVGELLTCDKIYLINSVRGWREVELIG